MHNLDIRTVTLALSLRDCIDSNVDVVCENIYNKIKHYAKNLVEYANELENDYSIPIINKRIAVTPISLIGESCKNPDYVKIAKTLDKAAKEVGVNFIGGFSALVEKGCTKGVLISPPGWLGFQYINLGEHIHSDHSSETEKTLSKTDTSRHKAFAETPFQKPSIYIRRTKPTCFLRSPSLLSILC